MNNTPITMAILLGTTRVARQSIKAARFVESIARQLDGVEVVFVDPAELNLPHDGDENDVEDKRYAEITARADAFYIVTPEYNHSFPSSLKRMLDSEYDNYTNKAAGVAGVSSGMWGGVRVCEAVQPVLHKLGLKLIQSEVYFPHVEGLFDEQGVMQPDQVDAYTAKVRKALDELAWLARTLRAGREQLAS